MKTVQFRENMRIALSSIAGQLLRTVLTIIIIAIGIMAPVGILTAIDAMKQAINSNFSSMGANTFTIRNRDANIRVGKGGKRPKVYRTVNYKEALAFSERYTFPAITSISTHASDIATIKFQGQKTNPNVEVIGSDENYMVTAGCDLRIGRNFSKIEITDGRRVVILGQ